LLGDRECSFASKERKRRKRTKRDGKRKKKTENKMKNKANDSSTPKNSRSNAAAQPNNAASQHKLIESMLLFKESATGLAECSNAGAGR